MTRSLAFATISVFAAVVTAAGPDGPLSLGVKGRENATPSIAAAGQVVAIVWGASSEGGATDVYVAVSRDAARTFGPPVRVNHGGSDARLNGEQPPRVALVPRAGLDPSIAVVWTAKGGTGTRLLSARSDDGGRTFGAATPIAAGAAGNRGWEAIAAGPDGRVIAVWLDHRELASPGGQSAPMRPGAHQGHDHSGAAAPRADGAARAQLSKLYFERLGSAEPPLAITGGVCYCCKTAVAVGGDGSIFASWRHVYPGNVRDIAFSVSRDHGRSFAGPIRVSDDRWVLDGCPENGPAMAVDGRNRVHLMWPTLVDGEKPDAEPTLALFHASSADGETFTPRHRVSTEGMPRHPQMAIASDGSVLAVWDEEIGGVRRVAIGKGTADPSAAVRFTRNLIADTARAVYPVVASVPDGAVIAWTSGTGQQSVIRVKRLDP